MNVLMYTMTMLLLLASITYTRIGSFRSHQLTENQFVHYLDTSTNIIADKIAEDRYTSIVTQPKKNDPNQPKKPKKPNPNQLAFSKLSWSILLKVDERNQDPSKLKKITELTKKLVAQLFENQKTVQNMLEKNPDLIDRLILSLIQAVDKTSQTIKLTKLEELASLDLQDEELNLLRYELFKENRYSPDAKINNKKKTYSLLDHLTHRTGKTRIYLASKPLLKSIFNQEDALIMQIIEKRNGFYNEVKSGRMTNVDATALFEEWIKKTYPYFDDNLFDCSVTKTDPKKHE